MYLSLKTSVVTSDWSLVAVPEVQICRLGERVACRPEYLTRVSAVLPASWLNADTDMRLAYQSRRPDFASSRRSNGTRFWSIRFLFRTFTACASSLMTTASE